MSTSPPEPAAALPAALAAAVQAASPWSPYPGLRPFQPDDADYFYGRRLEVDQVMQRLRDSRFVAVIGGSGSGKSSLVLAGAIPRLRTFAIKDAGDFWAPVVATPGTNHVAGDSPIWRLARKFCGQLKDLPEPAALAARLADCVALLREPGGFGLLVERFGEQLSGADGVDIEQLKVNFLFLLDQFEELFHPSNANDAFIAAECQHLVDRIVEQSKQRHPRVCVALTMRSEHLNDCPRYEELPDAINGSSYLVKRLSLAQLREAIEQPVVRYLRKQVAEQRDARREARRLGVGPPADAPPVPDRIRIDEALIEQLLADSKAVLADQGHADHLPLLQHLLFWIWHEATLRCAGRLVDALTLDDLRRAVGPPSPGAAAPPTTLEQCLENRCEDIYRRIDDPAAWESAFRSLAFKEPNTGTYTQQRASMAELGLRLGLAASGVDGFSGLAGRLAPWLSPHGYLHWDIDSRTVKVAHETLIRRWKRFRDWIDAEDRVFHVYLRLLEDCKNWQARDCGTKGLSGGETLRRYEDEKLPQILDDPVRMARIHRLLGIDRDGQRLADAAGDALRFLRLSIKIRSDREEARRQDAEKQREDQEKFALAQRDFEVERARNTAIEAQAEAARERTATAEAQTEAAQQRLYVANYKTSRFRVAMGLALTALLVVLPLGIWAWTLSSAEKRLATKERTLHRSYALAAESQVGFQPQFENLDGPQGRLRYALIGAQFYEDGNRMADGLSTWWPLSTWQRNLYSRRIDSLRNSERFGEARNTDSLRTILQGGVWAIPAAAAAASGPPVRSEDHACTTRLFAANDVPVATAHFVARPGAADARGLILETGENGGSTISVGRLDADAKCTIETQLLSTPPQLPVRVGIADDASSIVFGFENYTQFHRVVWNAPTGPRTEPRATVSSPLPGDPSEWNWRLRSASQPFWTDVALGNGTTVRLFEAEPSAIDDAVARRARQLVDVTAPNGSARCRSFAAVHGIDPAAGGERVWGLPAPTGRGGDRAGREYCIRVSTVGDGRATVHTASLYRLSTDAAADAADKDKDLPLVDRLLLGRSPPSGFALDEHDGWLAFQVDGAGWRAVPWSLEAFRRMASAVYQPYKPAPAGAGPAAAVALASKPVCGRPGEDPQFDLPYNLIIGSEMRCPDDAELKSKATPAAVDAKGAAPARAASGSTARP